MLDYVTVDSLQASLSDFTHVSAVNQTRTSLDSLGGALTVTIEAGSSLILNGTSDLTTLILGEHASLTLQGLTADAVVVDITGTSNYTLSLTEIPASLDNIKFLNDGVLYDAGHVHGSSGQFRHAFRPGAGTRKRRPGPGRTGPPPVEEAQKNVPLRPFVFFRP